LPHPGERVCTHAHEQILSDELRETVKRAFEAGEEDLWLGVVCCLGQKVVTALHGKHDDLFLNAQPTD
jgi:hypothetical protein